MSQILKFLGVDPEDLKWYHLSACANMHINWFYDDYETDKVLANNVDQLCMNCPVVKQCYAEGVANKEDGVRGGVYLNLGRTDKLINSHKAKDVWKQLSKIHGKNFL